MTTILLIIGVILLECIILGVGIYLGRKYFHKPPVKLKVSESSNINIESTLKEIQIRKELEFKKLKNKKTILPEMIYISGLQKERPIKRSDGDLIPYGLSDRDREILEMFYDKN